jgi:predicted nucleic acid-binding protein
MGQIAGKIDAEAKRAGRVIPFADLLIGSTALHFDYAVGTRNVRHFEMMPGLRVLKL